MDNIILLEDDISIARSFGRILEQEGYNVRKAANYREFFDVYSNFNPDLILLDVELDNREKNGLEIFDEASKALNTKTGKNGFKYIDIRRNRYRQRCGSRINSPKLRKES